MPFVYSTSSTNVEYAEFEKADYGQPPRIKRRVLIRGGSNVPTKHLVTPIGVMTEVSNEEAAFLATDQNFLRHAKAGFVVLRDRRVDPEVVAADMTLRDGSAPLVPADFDKPPTTELKAA